MFAETATKHPHFESACSRFAAAYRLGDIAKAAGIGAQMLRNKLNPDQPHQLTAADLIALYRATGDDTLFDGLLFDCGLTAVRLPEAGDTALCPSELLNTTAQIAGITAQAAPLLDGAPMTKAKRNAVVGGLMAGIERLVLLATEIEDKYHAVPSLACAADMARAAFGA